MTLTEFFKDRQMLVVIKTSKEWDSFIEILQNSGEYRIFDRASHWQHWGGYGLGIGNNHQFKRVIEGIGKSNALSRDKVSFEEFLSLVNGDSEDNFDTEVGDLI